jgi:KaiC/GvpD/RAD55 family RecA-like ATPase
MTSLTAWEKAFAPAKPKESAPIEATTEAAKENMQASKQNRKTTQSGTCALPGIPKVAPSILENLNGWLIWRYEAQSEGNGKPRKVPYYTNGGRRNGAQGSKEDRQKLMMFEQARDAAEQRGFDGVGLAILPDFGIVAGDFDNCIIDGLVHPDVFNLTLDTYAEISPSGNGVRAFWRGERLGNGKDPHGTPFGFEVFSDKGFVTFTGDILDSTLLVGNEDTVADVSDALRELVHDRLGKQNTKAVSDDPLMAYKPPVGKTYSELEQLLEKFDANTVHDKWIKIGMALNHETSGEGFELWNTWSENGDTYPGAEILQKRWDSFGNSTNPVTLRSLLKEDTKSAPAPLDPERFALVKAGTFARSFNTGGYHIKGILPRCDLVLLVGASGSGKSFIALDMAAAAARGVEWRGHRVKTSKVVYIIAEGGKGFKNRLAAYERAHAVNLDAVPFLVMDDCPNFLGDDDDRIVAKRIEAAGGADIIVVDTFAQVTPGSNENASEDVGRALSNCKRLHRATGATIILIHHTGKDLSRGARGWSGLKAAADTELTVDGDDKAPVRTMTISKNKDGAGGIKFPFSLKVVAFGFDEDGDEIKSCTIEHTDELPVKPDPRGPIEKKIIQAMSDLNVGDEYSTEEALILKTISLIDPPETGKVDRRREGVKRALKKLTSGERAIYCIEGNRIVPT